MWWIPLVVAGVVLAQEPDAPEDAPDDEIDVPRPGEPCGAAYEVVFDTGAQRPPGPLPAGVALRLKPRSSVLLRVAS